MNRNAPEHTSIDRFLRSGVLLLAVAIFAASGGTYQSGNYHISKHIMQYLYDGGAPSTGYACMHAKRQVMQRYATLASTARSYVFIGDPAIKIAGSITCNTDYTVSTVLDPNSNLYEYGQNVTIHWSCSGCPLKIHVKLIEDIDTERMIASYDQYDTPDLSSGSLAWPVTGISPDYENHYYRIEVLVWDLANNSKCAYSRTFDICEDMPVGKPGDHPFIGYSDSEGRNHELPLPGLKTLAVGESLSECFILPTSLGGNGGTVTFTMDGFSEKAVHFASIELCAVDALMDCNVYMHGSELFVSRDGEDEMPGSFALLNPYPNPFNPATTIEFHVPEPAQISIDIYNATGTHVRNLWDGTAGPGMYRLTWDGRNSSGNLVSSGIYFCRLTIDSAETLTRKLVLLR